MNDDSEVAFLNPGETCGEGCGREAVVEIDGSLTYCGTCLARLARLGRVFADAAEEAKVTLEAMSS